MYRDTGYKIAYSKVIIEPASEPVDRDAIADLHLKVDYSTDDNLIDLMITSSRQYVEQITGLSLITQTRRINFDHFPYCIYLSNGPVQSVVVKYRDENDVEQTLSASDYWIDTDSRIARIVVKNSWPSTEDRPNAVTIDYVAGYGDAVDVPSPLKEAVLLVLGWKYSNRDQPVPDDLIWALVSSYVVVQDVSY